MRKPALRLIVVLFLTGSVLKPDIASAQGLEKLVKLHAERYAIADTAHKQIRALQPPPRRSNWLKTHPVVFGAIVGFTAGFYLGNSAGDDGIFDDSDAKFNGLVLGGVGALAGAVIAGTL